MLKLNLKRNTQTQSPKDPQGVPGLAIKQTFFCLLITIFFSPAPAVAQEIPVTVSRDEQNYYEVTDAFRGIIKTRNCFEFVFFDSATLRLSSPTTGTLIFSNESQCSVANVFNPATVSPGTYEITVTSDGNGYYELLDGSWLIKANGIDFVSGQSAVLVITSAVNGVASGTITVGSGAARMVTNIYAQNTSGGTATDDIDLVVTGVDLLTDSYDSGGRSVERPTPGQNLQPHVYFDVISASAVENINYQIALGNSVLCSGSGTLASGSYWASCDPISVPASNFILSATLDPDSLLSETDKSNNTLERTFVVQSQSTLVTPQPGLWNIDEESNGEPGRGFQIDTQGNTLILTFYGYEATGEPTFYLSAGPFSPSGYQGELQTFEGGTAFGAPFTDAQLSGSAGTVTLTFDSSVTGTIQLPGEPQKAISRFSYADVTRSINGTFEGETRGIGPFSTDTTTYTLQLDDGEFSLVRDAFFSGECRFEGVYTPAGTGVDASGEYQCSDFSSGQFVAEQVSVNSLGVYSARIIRTPEGSNEQIEEIHSGL